jgi:hypothetical protein
LLRATLFMITAALTALLLAQPTLDEEGPLPSATVCERSFGLHLGINGGTLGAEWQHGHVMGFVSFSAAVTVIAVATAGSYGSHFGAVAGGGGYTFPLSYPGRSMWFMDVFGELVPSWYHQPFQGDQVHFGIGAGIGLRFLHESGFTFSVKVPVLGYAIGGHDELGFNAPDPQAGAGLFYMFSLLGTPIISFGYRWDVR